MYRSDRRVAIAPGPDVDLIPPAHEVVRTIDLPATRADWNTGLAAIPLTAISLGLGAAMAPFFATMFVVLIPLRWMFGEPARR